jgi:O-methyltransferase involved in polyketide biosynthesis
MIDPIRSTADDAVISKLAASSLGYYEDPFAAKLAQHGPVMPKRMPIINRGTWARVLAMDKVVDEFLCSSFGENTPRQIVSLGAGLDSRFFRLSERSSQQGGDQVTTSEVLKETVEAEPTFVVNGKVIRKSLTRRRSFTTRRWSPGSVAYFEVDFPDIVARKRASIQGNRALSKAAMITPGLVSMPMSDSFNEEDEEEAEEGENIAQGTTASSTENAVSEIPPPKETLQFGPYSLIAADLRDIPALDQAMTEAGFDHNLPTLFIAECLLVYLPENDASALLKWASGNNSTTPSETHDVSPPSAEQSSPSSSSPKLFVGFEMVNPHDAFGKVMVTNLRDRGVELHGMLNHPTLESQVERFTKSGWFDPNDKCAWNMLTVYNSGLMDIVERRRVESIEGLDELEEWELLMEHYCISLAYMGDDAEPMFRRLASSLDTVA